MFTVKQYGREVASFKTEAEACNYIETNKLSRAEVYDSAGTLVCFYV